MRYGPVRRDAEYPVRVRVFLVRHAKAAPGEPDELRPLTAVGVEQARELAEQLAAHPQRPALVLTSPLLRARQTAEAIARATGAELRVDARLAPGTTATALLDAVAETEEDAVATVGHQPDCSEIALALAGLDPGFPAGGMLELEVGLPG